MSALDQVEGVEVGAFDTATAGRSILYKFFGHAFCFPTSDLLGQWFEGANPGLVGDAAANLPYPSDDVAEDLGALFATWRTLDLETLRVRYTSLFDNCNGLVAVPLRESGYVRLDTKMLWEELVRFYEHFGLDFHLDHTRVWPDHLTAQLDMAHYLTFMETAGGNNLSPLIQGEHDFVGRHLANWLGDLCDRLARMTEAAPYRDLAGCLKTFVDRDLQYLACKVG